MIPRRQEGPPPMGGGPPGLGNGGDVVGTASAASVKDREERQTRRVLREPWRTVISALAAGFSLFYLYCAGFGVISTESHRAVYLMMSTILCIALYPCRRSSPKDRPSLVDLLLIALYAVCMIYWMNQYRAYSMFRVGSPSVWDLALGVAAIAISLEASRRIMGPALPILGLVFLFQLRYGSYLPGVLAHKGFSWVRIVEFTYCTMEAIFGVIAETFATYVFPFLIFGAFLRRSGGGDFFVNAACALTRRIAGGPAIAAVVGSGFFGSISGSPVANVVGTGSFTIPLMKRVGYPPHVAGAVEAAASTGGQFMPPVMGAGAFIMATLTETPYVSIMVHAAIPAVFYFLAVGVMVYLEAKRRGFGCLPPEDVPDLVKTLKEGWYHIASVVIIVSLMLMGYSPFFAAFWASLAVVGCSFFNKKTRMVPARLYEALADAGQGSLSVGATAATLGVIMGGITLAGLGVKFSAMVLSLSRGSLFLAIALVMVIGTVVGMGLPTTPSYIVMATLAAPALIKLGVPMLPAHLLVFWMAMSSNVTPPVCVASYAGASIAGADPMRTGLVAFKYSLFLYILPFTFAYFPAIMLIGPVGEVLHTVVSYAVGVVAFCSAVQGYLVRRCAVAERALLTIASLCLFVPGITTDLVGLALFAGTILVQMRRPSDDRPERVG